MFYSVLETTVRDNCNPSPCGQNAQCNNGLCSCTNEYIGDPYIECRPECVLNTDCANNLACIRNKCADPCPGVCGPGANCNVFNHIPMCSCPSGTTGNALILCQTAIGIDNKKLQSKILSDEMKTLPEFLF